MEIGNALYTAMRFHFLYVDRYMFGTGWVYPENFIPYSMVRYILRGSAEFVINGCTFTVRAGQVVYLCFYLHPLQSSYTTGCRGPAEGYLPHPHRQ